MSLKSLAGYVTFAQIKRVYQKQREAMEFDQQANKNSDFAKSQISCQVVLSVVAGLVNVLLENGIEEV